MPATSGDQRGDTFVHLGDHPPELRERTEDDAGCGYANESTQA
jgi:hypothetical protein